MARVIKHQFSQAFHNVFVLPYCTQQFPFCYLDCITKLCMVGNQSMLYTCSDKCIEEGLGKKGLCFILLLEELEKCIPQSNFINRVKPPHDLNSIDIVAF